ncbi:MAG TPA: serine/threonine-protein kinase [Kofleriaceae bacterium]|nr:serine/threonine-protein kinase [Kofleriaceae bacterium]
MSRRSDDEGDTQVSSPKLAIADENIATQTSSSKLPIDRIAHAAAAVQRPSVHDLETSIAPDVRTNPRSRPPTKTPSTAGGSTTVGSPLEALERDEILRTRWFCLIGLAVGLAGGASVAFLPGDPTVSLILLTAVAVAICAVVFLWMRTRDPIAFRKPSTGLGWFIPAACVTCAIPFYGAFSPVAVVLVLGVYFTGLGKSTKLAMAVYAVCAGMQAFIGILVIAGMRDTGIVHVEFLDTETKLVIQALVQVVLLATLITARMSRRTALAAVGELERVVRQVAHREALLLEAREELERALRQGRGRFSEQTIGGYQLGTVLGKGAMGEVYEATSPTGAVVAIKLLSQASLSNPNHVLRFLRELRTVAQVRSPNIVEVIEVGENPLPYLVMEKLEGQTLAEMMRGRRALSPDEVIDLVAQVGAGITAASVAGIVHRDLKPQNVFLDRGTWKVLDFGVARAMDGGDTLTAGQIVGTPSYMAPEQASGGTVDHGTDLYALAAIAYRALTGHPPYAAGEIAETLYRVVHTRPRRPTELVELPPEIDLVLAIGMAKQPAQRFRAATELAAAIAAAFAGTLPESVYERGRQLERGGAWSAGPPARASTNRMRATRPPR